MSRDLTYQDSDFEKDDVANESVGLLRAETGSNHTIPRKLNPSSVQKTLYCFKRYSLWVKYGSILLLILALYYLFSQYSLEDIADALSVFQRHPMSTLPLYVVANALAVIILCPGAILQMLAGVIFGFKLGLPVAWIGTNLGYCGAFIAGRSFLRDKIVSYINAKVPNFNAIETALSREGWRLLFLLRIAPVLPDSIMNYALSIMPFDFYTFAVASAAALFPYSVTYVYMGSMSNGIVDVLEHRSSHPNPEGSSGSHTLAFLPLILGVCIIAYVACLVRRVVRRALSTAEVELRAVSSAEPPNLPGVDAFIEIPARSNRASASWNLISSEAQPVDPSWAEKLG